MQQAGHAVAKLPFPDLDPLSRHALEQQRLAIARLTRAGRNATVGEHTRRRQVRVEKAGADCSGGAQWRAEAESGNFEAGYGVQLIAFRESLTNGEPAGKLLDGD